MSLLAIILGLYVTRNDRNLILLMCCLFAHVSLTSENSDEYFETEADTLGAAKADYNDEDTEGEEEQEAEEETAVVAGGDAISHPPRPPDHFKTTLSSGVFDRQLNTPQTNLTSTVFPATSVEANGKLASARGSFFEALVS